jgi:hypothetical protein
MARTFTVMPDRRMDGAKQPAFRDDPSLLPDCRVGEGDPFRKKSKSQARNPKQIQSTKSEIPNKQLQ